ncbi:MAG: DUF72 domain-containing protein [Holophagales bacterium]|nr:DUF72 domain-containing protein [Holophagales bacterium]
MPYSLGLPFWGFQDWVGSFYRSKTASRDFLGQYASVFGTVEGNTTFYSLPSPESVERWAELTPEGFRFCFKLPRQVTHGGELGSSEPLAQVFLERLRPLGSRLGPFMVQLPPSFGPHRLRELERFLARLPTRHSYAVEVRHPDFYRSAEAEDRLNRRLADLGCERCLMDTRPMRAGDLDHPDVAGARHEKPDLPVRPVALGPRPLIRMVGHPEAGVNAPWIEEWAEHLAYWIGQGRHPYFMVHVPNNIHAPGLARRLHRRLAEALEPGWLPDLPPFPAELEAEEGERQLSLF